MWSASRRDAPAWVRPSDSWWVVLAMDPFGIRLVQLISSRGLSPNTLTVASLGIRVGACLAGGLTGSGLALFALWQLGFLLDCMDGQLARRDRRTSRLGARLDAGSDVAVTCLLVGLVVVNPDWWRLTSVSFASGAALLLWLALWLRAWYGSGEFEHDDGRPGVLGRWFTWTASRRLKPWPVSGIEESAVLLPLGVAFGLLPAVVVFMVANRILLIALGAVLTSRGRVA
jgi:phosphatidylglycerophosphate synthase